MQQFEQMKSALMNVSLLVVTKAVKLDFFTGLSTDNRRKERRKVVQRCHSLSSPQVKLLNFPGGDNF